jgi:hypothetical protein
MCFYQKFPPSALRCTAGIQTDSSETKLSCVAQYLCQRPTKGNDNANGDYCDKRYFSHAAKVQGFCVKYRITVAYRKRRYTRRVGRRQLADKLDTLV